jgi:membrane protein implicated in regulation of membrane protease activity
MRDSIIDRMDRRHLAIVRSGLSSTLTGLLPDARRCRVRAAGAAWLGYDFPLQVVGRPHPRAARGGRHREKNRNRQMPSVAGMPASFETWIDAPARLARVRYRGASWDARVEGPEALEPGTTVYVLATDGNTLKVGKNRPA